MMKSSQCNEEPMFSLRRFSGRQQYLEGTGWSGPKGLTITLAQSSQTGAGPCSRLCCPSSNGFPMEYLQKGYRFIGLGHV